MLVLSRKLNESILLNSNIEVIVLGMDGENVKLGIRAPREVSILRKELYTEIERSNQEASRTTAPLGELAQLMKKDLKNESNE